MKRYKYRKTFTFNGKRYAVTADSVIELESKVALKKQSLERNTVFCDGSMTVRQWATQAVAIYKTGQSEITRQKYVQRMNHCILAVIGNMRLVDVLPIHLQQCLNMQSGKSKRHINEIYQQIQFIFKTAMQNRLIESNPADGLTKPQGTVGTCRRLRQTA